MQREMCVLQWRGAFTAKRRHCGRLPMLALADVQVPISWKPGLVWTLRYSSSVSFITQYLAETGQHLSRAHHPASQLQNPSAIHLIASVLAHSAGDYTARSQATLQSSYHTLLVQYHMLFTCGTGKFLGNTGASHHGYQRSSAAQDSRYLSLRHSSGSG